MGTWVHTFAAEMCLVLVHLAPSGWLLCYLGAKNYFVLAKIVILLFPGHLGYGNPWRLFTARLPVFALQTFALFRKMGKEGGG